MDSESRFKTRLKRIRNGTWYFVCRTARIKSDLSGLIRISCFLITTLSPIWLRLLFGEQLAWKTAIGAAAVLVLVSLFVAIERAFRESKRRHDERISVALQFSGQLKHLAPLFSDAGPGRRHDMAERCRYFLEMIRDEARLYLGPTESGDLVASLMLFDSGCTQMQMVQSTSTSRVLAVTNPESTVAYYVCLRPAATYAVHDYHEFSKLGLAGEPATYRSFFMVSLDFYGQTVENPRSIGVVSIDTAAPYRFWPKRSYNDLEAVLAPSIELLKMLLADRAAEGSGQYVAISYS